MKARIQLIGDYDEDSKTYGVLAIADEAEVNASTLEEGDEVELVLCSELERIANDYIPDNDGQAPQALAEMREALQSLLANAGGQQ